MAEVGIEQGIEPPTSRPGVRDSTTRPPRSPPSSVTVQPALFVLDLVGNPEDRFFHDMAQTLFCKQSTQAPTGGLSFCTRLSQLPPYITVFSCISSLFVTEQDAPIIHPEVSWTWRPT